MFKYRDQPLCGKSMTLKVAPIALGGKFVFNLANTAPVFPCDRLIRPQIVCIIYKLL
jgi:hypothetical protein